MKKLQERKVDAVTRAILHPWVREATELLSLWRTNLQHEILDQESRGPDCNVVRVDHCSRLVRDISRVLDAARNAGG